MPTKGKASKKILDLIHRADYDRAEQAKVTGPAEDKMVRCENCRDCDVRPNERCARCGTFAGKDGGTLRIGGE